MQRKGNLGAASAWSHLPSHRRGEGGEWVAGQRSAAASGTGAFISPTGQSGLVSRAGVPQGAGSCLLYLVARIVEEMAIYGKICLQDADGLLL